MTWAIWLTGLPGSGKSTIVKELEKLLSEKGISAEVLSMDQVRKQLTPEQKYDANERKIAYAALVDIGKQKYDQGINIIFDATAHKQSFRDYAREKIENFKEIYIKCNLKTAMQREANRKSNLVVSNLYQKALKRLEGEKVELMGEMIGIDVPYEEPLSPELTIDAEMTTPEDAAKKILELVK